MKRLLLLLLSLITAGTSIAHIVDYELDPKPGGEVFTDYLAAGFEHIIPLGLDHILFILCVFFMNTSLRQLLLQATMFTLAHSITLGLSMYGLITPALSVVEPLIAASILFLALENIWSGKKWHAWRLVMVFVFGMVHGMGFAGALSELGLPQYAFATALIAFNIGVEIGQLCIILVMHFLVARLFSARPWYRSRIVIPSSLAIALVAAFWVVERIFF
jgi:hydrogenase/urease accessory protein HupE